MSGLDRINTGQPPAYPFLLAPGDTLVFGNDNDLRGFDPTGAEPEFRIRQLPAGVYRLSVAGFAVATPHVLSIWRRTVSTVQSNMNPPNENWLPVCAQAAARTPASATVPNTTGTITNLIGLGTGIITLTPPTLDVPEVFPAICMSELLYVQPGDEFDAHCLFNEGAGLGNIVSGVIERWAFPFLEPSITDAAAAATWATKTGSGIGAALRSLYQATFGS